MSCVLAVTSAFRDADRLKAKMNTASLLRTPLYSFCCAILAAATLASSTHAAELNDKYSKIQLSVEIKRDGVVRVEERHAITAAEKSAVQGVALLLPEQVDLAELPGEGAESSYPKRLISLGAGSRSTPSGEKIDGVEAQFAQEGILYVLFGNKRAPFPPGTHSIALAYVQQRAIFSRNEMDLFDLLLVRRSLGMEIESVSASVRFPKFVEPSTVTLRPFKRDGSGRAEPVDPAAYKVSFEGVSAGADAPPGEGGKQDEIAGSFQVVGKWPQGVELFLRVAWPHGFIDGPLATARAPESAQALGRSAP